MNALELMDRLGGEILMNKVHVRIDGEIVIAAYLNDAQEWEFTEAGQLLANEHSNLAVDEANAPKTRKKAIAVVESVVTSDEPEIVVSVEATE
jgi:hypothetical protein